MKPSPEPTKRLTSVDAYRGFVMFLMVAEIMHLPGLARAYPDNWLLQVIGHHTSHVEWFGCALHDLIQPSFSFLVGVAVPYSITSRIARGQSIGKMAGHALWRAILLILLGVFLRSVNKSQTNFTFEDTLSQIGFGYFFLFLLGFRSMKVQAMTLAVILVGYWLAFALYPLPGPEFDYARVGVPADWPYHLEGFAAHWNKNSNLGWASDVWFLNLFPRKDPFLYNGGNYATLSFIPTLGTMIMGLLAAGGLRSGWPEKTKVWGLAGIGIGCLLLGLVLHAMGVCPLVKKIWTPTWTIFSGGWCLILLAAFYGVIDVLGYRAWAFPLVVIGMNSIAIYCLVHLADGFVLSSLRTHLGSGIFKIFGEAFEPTLLGAAAVLVFWLILYWMYRRKIFLKV